MVGGGGGKEDARFRPAGGVRAASLPSSVLLGERLSLLSISRLCFASRSVTRMPSNSFCRLANLSSYDSVKVLAIVFRVSWALSLGFQSIGHNTPCLATAWNASSNRSASSTLRPTVRLLSVICESSVAETHLHSSKSTPLGYQ